MFPPFSFLQVALMPNQKWAERNMIFKWFYYFFTTFEMLKFLYYKILEVVGFVNE